MKRNMSLVAVICGICLLALTACKDNKVNPPAPTDEISDADGRVDPLIEKRIAKYEAWLKSAPGDTLIMGILADLYQYKDMTKAEDLINKAVSISPQTPRLLRIQADILQLSGGKHDIVGKYKKAIELFGEDRRVQKEKSFAYLGLARYYDRRRDQEKTLQYARKALEINKSDEQILKFLRELEY